MQKIKIACTSGLSLPLNEISIFPSKLKKHSQLEIERLCDSIVNDGFLFPLAIGKLGDKNYVIDETISSFNRDIDKAALIITHITAMTFIYLAYGKKVMRFTGDELYYNLPEEICFNTKEDFIDKINKIDSVNYKEIAKNHIEFVGSESKQRYNEAFRLLNNSI